MMNDPFEVLRAEHRAALEQLDRLSTAIAELDQLEPGLSDEAREILESTLAFFHRDLALHLSKEEEVLFPAIEPVLTRAGPIAVMESEHADLRKNIQHLDELISSLVKAGPSPDKLFAFQTVMASRSLIERLTLHIHKEDEILFRLADEALDATEKERMAGQMAELEAAYCR